MSKENGMSKKMAMRNAKWEMWKEKCKMGKWGVINEKYRLRYETENDMREVGNGKSKMLNGRC
mgnify:CR=1 FL=1